MLVLVKNRLNYMKDNSFDCFFEENNRPLSIYFFNNLFQNIQ